jgi:hypothetical protein
MAQGLCVRNTLPQLSALYSANPMQEKKVIGYAAVLKNVRNKTPNHEIFKQEQE